MLYSYTNYNLVNSFFVSYLLLSKPSDQQSLVESFLLFVLEMNDNNISAISIKQFGGSFASNYIISILFIACQNKIYISLEHRCQCINLQIKVHVTYLCKKFPVFLIF